jgi:hypothetical protein
MEAALRVTTWREIFVVLVVATVAASAWLFLRAPDEARPEEPETLSAQLRGVATVFRNLRYWRCVPLAMTFTAGFMAVQGLWATSWLMRVNGYGRDVAAGHLTGLNLAMLGGYLAIGLAATPLARREITASHIVGVGVPAAIATLVLIVTEATPHTRALWTAYGVFSCCGTLLYTVNARAFPVELAGRASTALNVSVFLGAFGLQWGIGGAIDLLRARGLDPAAAHRAAFWALLALQAIAYALFLATARWARTPRQDTRPEAPAQPAGAYAAGERLTGGPT